MFRLSAVHLLRDGTRPYGKQRRRIPGSHASTPARDPRKVERIMWPATHTDPEPEGGGGPLASREHRSGMQLPRRETPTPPRELASFQGHAIDRLRRADVDGARRLLTRLSVSFAGITSRAMCRAICVSSARRGVPMILVARRGEKVVGLAIAAYDTETFWHGFFLRHPLLALVAILKRLAHRGESPAARDLTSKARKV